MILESEAAVRKYFAFYQTKHTQTHNLADNPNSQKQSFCFEYHENFMNHEYVRLCVLYANFHNRKKKKVLKHSPRCQKIFTKIKLCNANESFALLRTCRKYIERSRIFWLAQFKCKWDFVPSNLGQNIFLSMNDAIIFFFLSPFIREFKIVARIVLE